MATDRGKGIQSLEDDWTAHTFQQPKRDYSPKHFLVLLLTATATLFGLAFLEKPSNILLGLDLIGGTTIVLQPQQTGPGVITPDAVQQVLEILRQRVDGLGVFKCS